MQVNIRLANVGRKDNIGFRETESPMTKAQVRKLNKLTGEIEAFQRGLPDDRATEWVAKAKDALMEALRRVERGQS